MHHLSFTQDEGDDPATLSLWINQYNKLYIEMQTADDPYSFQHIVLDLDDVKMLANELIRLARQIEHGEIQVQKPPRKKVETAQHQAQLKIATGT